MNNITICRYVIYNNNGKIIHSTDYYTSIEELIKNTIVDNTYSLETTILITNINSL